MLGAAQHESPNAKPLYRVPIPSGSFLGTPTAQSEFRSGQLDPGEAMLEILALATAAVVVPVIVVLGLFRLAGLKRVEDLQPPPHADEWTASHEPKTE